MSDQDFFFDEDDAAAEKPEPARTQVKGPARAPRSAAAATAVGAQQSVTMTVAGLIGVVALLIGIIIGILIPTGGGQVGSPATAPSVGTNPPAAPLSPEQLEGGMPPGHPDIGGLEGGEAAPPADGTEEPGTDGEAPAAEDPAPEEDAQ